MQWLDNLKNLLLRRFTLVLAVVVLGTTPFVHAFRVAGIFRVAGEAAEHRKQAMAVSTVRLSEENVRAWNEAVPAGDLMEAPRFMIAVRGLAQRTGCQIGGMGDGQPSAVDGAEDLVSVDSTVSVKGTYEALIRFTGALRREPRVLTLTRADISPEQYPLLNADLTVRRYLRRDETSAATE
jgi:hypothetical protein